MRDNVQFSYCKTLMTADCITYGRLALARYTSYDPENRVLAVEQVTYQDDESGHTEFECQVTTALTFGIDVAVMSYLPLDHFPFLEHLVTE